MRKNPQSPTKNLKKIEDWLTARHNKRYDKRFNIYTVWHKLKVKQRLFKSSLERDLHGEIEHKTCRLLKIDEEPPLLSLKIEKPTKSESLNKIFPESAGNVKISLNKHSDTEDEDFIGPKPFDVAQKVSKKINYGTQLRPGEGEAMAQYIMENRRIPRRGEVGLSSTLIESFENLGYVMSGSRHRKMNVVRIRKENQVYSAEEQRALALYNYEEQASREAQLIVDLKELLKQNSSISDNKNI